MKWAFSFFQSVGTELNSSQQNQTKKWEQIAFPNNIMEPLKIQNFTQTFAEVNLDGYKLDLFRAHPNYYFP